MVDEKKYHIGLSFDKKGNYIYVVKEFVKKTILDDHIKTYTYDEAVKVVKTLNKKL